MKLLNYFSIFFHGRVIVCYQKSKNVGIVNFVGLFYGTISKSVLCGVERYVGGRFEASASLLS
jgi:hypothetical protein